MSNTAKIETFKDIYTDASRLTLQALDMDLNHADLDRLSLAYGAARQALKSLRATAKSIVKEK
jgi:hypothetical protein